MMVLVFYFLVAVLAASAASGVVGLSLTNFIIGRFKTSDRAKKERLTNYRLSRFECFSPPDSGSLVWCSDPSAVSTCPPLVLASCRLGWWRFLFAFTPRPKVKTSPFTYSKKVRLAYSKPTLLRGLQCRR